MWGSVGERVILAIGDSADANAQRPEGDQLGTNIVMCLLGNESVRFNVWCVQPWRHQKCPPRPLTCTNSVSEGGLEPSERRFLDQQVSSICPGFPCQSTETGTQLLTVGAGYNGSVQPPGARMILVTDAAAAVLVNRLSRGALPTRRPVVGTRR